MKINTFSLRQKITREKLNENLKENKSTFGIGDFPEGGGFLP